MKIVCDFDKIRDELAKIEDSITAMDKALSDYKTSVAQSLTSWTGVAKEAFEATNTEQVTSTNTHVTDMTSVVDFVKSAVDKIESLENDLANLNI